jgi:hypothetical protein
MTSALIALGVDTRKGVWHGRGASFSKLGEV